MTGDVAIICNDLRCNRGKNKEQSLNLRQEQSWSFVSTYMWYVKERRMDIGTAEGDKDFA